MRKPVALLCLAFVLLTAVAAPWTGGAPAVLVGLIALVLPSPEWAAVSPAADVAKQAGRPGVRPQRDVSM